MAIQYRSLIDFAAILAGNREGINAGIDSSIFLRQEAIERTFEAPRIGTQGSSIGLVAASTDLSGGTDDKIDIAVDGGAVVTATMAGVAGLTTGALIEAALELAINTALAADAQDARVWVFYDVVDDHYEVYSQKTGESTSVVITDAGVDNAADDLNIGVANGGSEAVGTDDQDYLLYTTGGINFNQPIESSPHRSGRFHVGPIKQKKVVEFDMDTLLNMLGPAGDSIDEPMKLLYKSAYGSETVTPAVQIDYEQGLPNFTFSCVKASTIFAEYYTGCYVKDHTLTVPGDVPATQKFTGMGSDSSIAGIGKVDGAVVASATIQLDATHAQRFSAGARVMAVKADGRTIVAGFDGSLLVNAEDVALDQLTLSAAIDLEDDGFITFWHPGAVQQSARDNIYTDLEGSFKFTDSGANVCATNITLSTVNDHVDLNNCFGADANEGFAAVNRVTMTLSVTLDLSNENFGDLVQTRKFGGFDGELIIGDVAGRHLVVDWVRWIVSVPPIDLPENGTTPVTFEGVLYQSDAGARDPIKLSFK